MSAFTENRIVDGEHLQTLASPSGRAGGADPKRVERPACQHEEAAPAIASEADIGAALRQVAASHGRPPFVAHHHPVEALAASPAAPQIAIHVDAQAITATLFRADEDAPVDKSRAVAG